MHSGNGQHPVLRACGRTDVGLKRQANEDSIKLDENLRLFAIADGMGGHAAGEIASRTAIETLHEFVAHAAINRDFTWPFGIDSKFSLGENVLLTGIHLANRRVCRLAGENETYSGMGTTVAAIYAPERVIHIGHVGDSRVYRLRGNELQLLTDDHSWVNEQLKRNIITEDEARNHRWRNVITRALGNRQDVEVDLKSVDMQCGDLFLICSDGLTGMVDDQTLHQVLSTHPQEDLQALCGRLVELANEAGGQDNISVILVRVE